MCTPLAIAGAAAMVGGTLLNGAQADAQDSARADATNAETERQKKLRQEAMTALGSSEKKFGDIPGEQDENGQKVGDLLNQNTRRAQPGANLMPTASDPTVVAEVGKQQDKSNKYVTQQGDALGAVRGFGDLMGGANRQLMGDSGWINTLNNFQRGSAGVLPSELQAANGAGSTLGMFGDLLSGAGGMGLTAGLGGGMSPLQGAGTPLSPGGIDSVLSAPASASPWTTKAGGLMRLFG